LGETRSTLIDFKY